MKANCPELPRNYLLALAVVLAAMAVLGPFVEAGDFRMPTADQAQFGSARTGPALANGAKENEKRPTSQLLDRAGTVAALDLISKRISANLERIETWSGEYDIVDETFYPEAAPLKVGTAPTLTRTTAVVSFALDLKNDRLRTDFKRTGPIRTFEIDAESGERIFKDEQNREDEYRSILTADEWVSFATNERLNRGREYPHVPWKATGERFAVRRHRRDWQRYSEFMYYVDPRDFIGKGTGQFHQFWILYAAALRGERTDQERKHAERNTRIVKTGDEPANRYVCTVDYVSSKSETICNAAYDWNPSSWRQVDPDGNTIVARYWEYKVVNGLFLIPSQIIMERFPDRRRKDRFPAVFKRTLTLKTAELNQPLDQSQFEPASLGLKAGEKLVDEISGKVLRFDRANFIPFPEDP